MTNLKLKILLFGIFVHLVKYDKFKIKDFIVWHICSPRYRKQKYCNYLNPHNIFKISLPHKPKEENMKKDVIKNLSALIIAAFGLVAALAWNGAIQAIFKQVYGTPDTVGAMLIYAVVVTVIAVIVTIWIGKAESKLK